MNKNKLIIVLLIFAALISFSNSGLCIDRDSQSIPISNLDFENAEIRQIMKTLSVIGNQNIIVDNGIVESCSIYLNDVTWKEAFLAVLKMNDLVAYSEGIFIKVLKSEDYDTQVTALLERERLEKQAKPASVSVVKIHNARAEDIKTTLDPLLGDDDQPSVDLRTNSLVFTVSDSSLAVISKIIEELDTETKQVSIEVKMVTVDSNSMTELGINWSAINNDKSISQRTIGSEDKLLVAEYAAVSGNTNLLATISSLIDQNQAEVVSRPHITTQDNEPATISSGHQVPYVTFDEARNTVVEMIDASTELTVTPHVLSDNRILLDVNAIRRTAEGAGIGIRVSDESAQVKMITTNGETAVIGGLRQMNEAKQESGIPILQNIPLIGQLFKYTKREMKNTDLIIFITPRIEEKLATNITQ
ncbi:secretin N-terminal domain-containing protein [Candidatus Latescibacterota bacterium]